MGRFESGSYDTLLTYYTATVFQRYPHLRAGCLLKKSGKTTAYARFRKPSHGRLTCLIFTMKKAADNVRDTPHVFWRRTFSGLRIRVECGQKLWPEMYGHI